MRTSRSIPVLHVKRHTRGTSNELSLDVLDAKRDAVEEVKGSVPAASLDILQTCDSRRHFSASTGLGGDSAAEITRRKARRRHVRALNVVAVAVVVTVMGLAGFTYLENHMSEQHIHTDTLVEAINLISQSDDVVVTMDEALHAPLDERSLADMKQLSGELAGAESLLDRATNKAQEAMVGMEGGRDHEMAQRVVADAAARKALIAQGKVLMASDAAAKQAADDLQDAWSEVLTANTLEEEAARLVSHTTADSVQQSRVKTEQALQLFQQAQANVQYAKNAYPAIDVQTLSDYLGKRISCQQYALASDTAILLQDRAAAESNNERANEAAEQAAHMAENLPANPIQSVLDACSQVDSQTHDAYIQARQSAAEQDAYLRDYLGAADK